MFERRCFNRNARWEWQQREKEQRLRAEHLAEAQRLQDEYHQKIGKVCHGSFLLRSSVCVHSIHCAHFTFLLLLRVSRVLCVCVLVLSFMFL